MTNAHPAGMGQEDVSLFANLDVDIET